MVEYGIAAVVASSGARLSEPTLPIVAAVVIVVLAATADGPVAAMHLVKRGPHRVADWVIGTALIVAAVLLFGRVGSSPALLTGLAGVCVLALSWRTNYAPKPVKVKQAPSATRAALARFRRPTGGTVSPSPVRPDSAAPVARPAPTPVRPEPVARPAPTPVRPEPESRVDPGPELEAEAADRPEPTSSLPPTPARPQISRGARAEKVGRKAGKYAAVGVKVWRNRKN